LTALIRCGALDGLGEGNRSEQMWRALAWERTRAVSGMLPLSLPGLPTPPPAPEHDRLTRWAFEANGLGFLVSAHPLTPHRDRLARLRAEPGPEWIAAADLPSQRERITMLENANRQLTSHGYEAIGMDHYALAGDSLALAARQGRLHRNFQGYTTGGELDLLGIGPTAISQFTQLFSQNQRDLRAWREAIEAGLLPVERGLEVRDAEVLERRHLIREVMCHFQVELDLNRYAREWADLQALAADGLVELHRRGERGLLRVTSEGRWLIRTIAAVFDPQQRKQARGSRLV